MIDDKQITIGEGSKEICEACNKLKICHLYITMVGAAWVCKECRTGK